MKKCILFFFFTFHAATHAQHVTISDSNFETSTINSGKQAEKKITREIVLPIKNMQPYTNLKTRNDWAINRLYFLRTPLKKLDISQNINLDYFVFRYNHLLITDAQKKLKTLPKIILPIS